MTHKAVLEQVPLQADRRYLTDAAALSMIRAPVEVRRGASLVRVSSASDIRRGDVLERITFILPTFEGSNRFGQNPYIVSHVPKDQVYALRKHLDTLPEPQRGPFVMRWVKLNQARIRREYLAFKKESFRFDIVRLADVSERAPRRVARKPKPRSRAPKRVAKKPKPRRRKAPTIKRTPKRTAPSRRQIGKTPTIKGPSAPPARRLTPFPRGVSGMGTSEKPYIIEPPKGRETADIGSTPVNGPLNIDLGNMGMLHSTIKFTASQLRSSQLSATKSELVSMFSKIIKRNEEERGMRTNMPKGKIQAKIMDAVDTYQKKLLAAVKGDKEFENYILKE